MHLFTADIFIQMILDSDGVAGALICYSSGLIGIETPEDSAILNSKVF